MGIISESRRNAENERLANMFRRQEQEKAAVAQYRRGAEDVYRDIEKTLARKAAEEAAMAQRMYQAPAALQYGTEGRPEVRPVSAAGLGSMLSGEGNVR